MKFDADSILPFPREIVFRTYRDELEKAVPHMPNVRSIEHRSSADEGAGRRRVLRVWTAGGDIPASLRAFISGGGLSWDDDALWSEEAWTSEWTIRSHLFSEAVRCHGRTQLVELGPSRTRLELQGEFSLDPKKIAALPALVAGPLVRTAESFLTRQITANLASTADAVTRLLRAQS